MTNWLTRVLFCLSLSVFAVGVSAQTEDLKVRVNTGGTLRDVRVQRVTTTSVAPEQRTTGLILSAAGDQSCDEAILGEISGWPETKVEMELYCVDIPLVGRVCTDLPRTYARSCKKRVVGQFCYPSGTTATAALRDCAIAGAATAVAACLAGGCGAAAPAFEAGFKACVAIKVPALANEVTVGLTERTDCEGWHPI